MTSMLPQYLPDAVIVDVSDAVLDDDTLDPEDFALVASALTDLALNDTHARVAVSADFEGRDIDDPDLSAVDVVALTADYYYGNYYTGD